MTPEQVLGPIVSFMSDGPLTRSPPPQLLTFLDPAAASSPRPRVFVHSSFGVIGLSPVVVYTYILPTIGNTLTYASLVLMHRIPHRF
jgi:hypothetical protein